MPFRPAFIRAHVFRRPPRKPGISISRFAFPGVGSLTITGALPTSVCNVFPAIPAGALTLTGRPPTSICNVFPAIPTGALILTPRTLTSSLGFSPSIPSGSLTLTGKAPVHRAWRVRRDTLIILRAKAVLDLDFVHGTYEIAGSPGAAADGLPLYGVTRASVGTSVSSAGLVRKFTANQSRFSDLGLTIEPAGTNLLVKAEDLSFPPPGGASNPGGWFDFSAGVTTVTANVVSAPDGTLTADRLVGNNANTWWGQNVGFGFASKTMTFSGWLWTTSAYTLAPKLTFGISGGTTYGGAWNLTTVPTRYSFTQAFVGGDVGQLAVAMNHGNGNTTYVWGMQLEESPIPTTYVPTNAASVARAADVGLISIVPPPAFTLFADADLDNLDGVSRYLATWDDGTANNYIIMVRYSDNAAYVQAYSNGVVLYNDLVAAKVGARRLKMAMSYDGTTWRGSIDGAAMMTTVAGRPAMSFLRLGAIYTGTGGYLQGRLRRVQALNSALSTAAMQALTA